MQASVSGNSFGYVTTYPPEGSPSDGLYLRVTRGPSGWSSEELIPPQSAHYGIACRSGYIAAYSSELTSEVLADGVGQPGSLIDGGVLQCGADDPQLLETGEPQGFQNLFLAGSEEGPYQLVDEIGHAAKGFSVAGAWFEAASEDLSHVVFTEAARLTPEAPEVEQAAELTKSGGPLPDLYEWTTGGLRLLTVLPSGASVAGSLANGFLPEDETCCGGAETYTHAVSADGSRVFFQATGNLYLRVNAEQSQSAIDGGGNCSEPAAACTVQVDAGQGGTESGGGKFMWATPDATRVFFVDERRLTSDSTAAAGAPDLYEYNLSAPAGARLRDLTPHTGEPANVLGVSGVSDDGSYVYFVADAKLVATEDSVGGVAIAGQPNLYLAHGGAITFIATLAAANDETDWNARRLAARVTPDGTLIAFNSERPLTGYDNVDVASGERDDEIFLFSAASESLACVSCSAPGTPSTAYAHIPVTTRPIFGGGSPLEAAGYLQRNLADDGRVFFSTAQRLLPEAANGQSNVYEYDAGALHLISTGTSTDPSYFYDASADGSDVFFITSQNLPSGEPANEFRVYDAREGGGFPNPPSPEEACAGEGCRRPAVPPTEFTAPLTTASLPSGNLPPLAGEVKSNRSVSPPKSPAQIRREKLARALKRCRKMRNKHKRSACEAQARHQYGAKKAARQGRR